MDDLRVDAAEGTINTNVGFTFHGADRLQLKAHGDLRGEALHTWLPLLDTLRGNLGVDFTLPASKGAPAFADVAVAGKDVSWQQVLVNDFAATGALETGGITLDTMRVAVGAGTAQGNGRLAWEDAGQSHAVLDFRNMDAGRLWRTLLAKSPGALYVAPASVVSGHFEGHWTAWHAGAIDATLRTTWQGRPSGREHGERLWLDGRVDARFRRGPWTIDVDARADNALAMRGTIHTRGSQADYAKWPLAGTLALSGPVAPVVLDAFRYADLDASPEFGSATGDLTGTAELSETFGTARAALSLHSDLAWPDQPAVAVDLDATVDPSALQVTSFHGGVRRVDGDGHDDDRLRSRHDRRPVHRLPHRRRGVDAPLWHRPSGERTCRRGGPGHGPSEDTGRRCHGQWRPNPLVGPATLTRRGARALHGRPADARQHQRHWPARRAAHRRGIVERGWRRDFGRTENLRVRPRPRRSWPDDDSRRG